MNRHSYEVIPGLFISGDADGRPPQTIQILPRFGLADASPGGWENLKRSVSLLNGSAPAGTSYRVLFLGRHGEGVHNVAERLYGSEEWNKNLAKLNGNGVMTWGPDPKLTDLGIQQAHVAHSAWVTELARAAPLPESLYASPLGRAVHTALITFDGILINAPTLPSRGRPLIKEKLREMNGVHTCDRRSPRSQIAEEFPQFDIEPGFSEEDRLWRADHRETEEEMTVRVREALDEIFSEDPSTYISITAHGGAARAIMRATGHQPYTLPIGGVMAFVVKVVTQQPEGK